MRKFKIFSFVLGIMCLMVSTMVIINNTRNDNNPDNSGIEIINREYKIGINTKLKIINEYTLCGHQVVDNVDITSEMINLNYDDIVLRYIGYQIIEFDSDKVTLKRVVNEYCNEHYLIKETDGKLVLYRMLNDDKIEVLKNLEISIDTLRQNDRYMFKNTGVIINGKENLYRFLEDFDS